MHARAACVSSTGNVQDRTQFRPRRRLGSWLSVAIQLIENVALVFLLITTQQYVLRRWEARGAFAQVLTGLMYGGIGVVAMAGPIVLSTGYQFDGRTVILTIAGLFGGPIVATTAVIVCGAYRLWIGGIGAIVGTFVIVESALFGLLFYYLRRRGVDVMRPAALLALGVAVHAVVLWSQIFGLGLVGLEAIRRVGPMMMLVFPLATLLAARLVLGEEERHQMRESLQRQAEQLAGALDSAIRLVDSVVEMRDPYTAGHQRRTALLATRIAEKLDLPAGQVRMIEVAAFLHDVGKIAVPAEILAKPGQLSGVERSLIESHAEAGYRLLLSSGMDGPLPELIHQHHERCDGSGYPRGLKAVEILRGSKIIMVADVVAAMSAHRPYRAAHTIDEALETIRAGAGTLYDRIVVDAALDVFEDATFSLDEGGHA